MRIRTLIKAALVAFGVVGPMVVAWWTWDAINEKRLDERALHILAEPYPDVRTRIGAFQSLVAFVVGHSLSSYAGEPSRDAAPGYAALSDEQFPILSGLESVVATRSQDEEFEFGLDALLRGFAAKAAVAPPSRQAEQENR